MNQKTYMVLVLQEDGDRDVSEFDNLMTAFKYYLQDITHRRLFREISVEIKEK